MGAYFHSVGKFILKPLINIADGFVLVNKIKIHILDGFHWGICIVTCVFMCGLCCWLGESCISPALILGASNDKSYNVLPPIPSKVQVLDLMYVYTLLWTFYIDANICWWSCTFCFRDLLKSLKRWSGKDLGRYNRHCVLLLHMTL